MKDKVGWNTGENTTLDSLTSSLLELKDLLSKATHHLPSSDTSAFFLLTAKPKGRNPLQSTSEKLPLLKSKPDCYYGCTIIIMVLGTLSDK